MASRARLHYVDGREVTVAEMAEELGVTRQQLYDQMNHRGVSLQTAVRMIRENLVLNGQGYRAGRHMVDGRWMTFRQVSEMIGWSEKGIREWMYRHRRPDGSLPRLAEAVEAWREGRVKYGGTKAVQHKVGKRTMTTFEAAEKLGVTINAVRSHMCKHKASLASTIRYYEKRKLKQAEKDILAILMEGKS